MGRDEETVLRQYDDHAPKEQQQQGGGTGSTGQGDAGLGPSSVDKKEHVPGHNVHDAGFPVT